MKQGGIWALMALALLLGVLVAKDGGAADWSVVPNVGLRGEFNSNLNYSFENKISDFLFTLNPGADFKYDTEILQMQGHVGWTGLVYAKSSGADHIDQNYFISGKYAVTPRLNLNLNAGYVVDSSLQQELATSGIIMTRTPRQSYVLAPGLTYALTERLSATAGYQYSPVNYQDPNFRNYTTQQANFSLAYSLKNQKTIMSLNFLGTDTKYTDDDINQVMQFSLGINHKVSEVWAITFNGGGSLSFIDSKNQVLSSAQAPFFVLAPQRRLQQTSLSPYFAIYATRSWAKTNISAGYARDQSSSGAGSINNFQGFSLSLNQTLTERLTGTLGGGFYLSEAISQRTGFNTTFYKVSPQFSYQMTEQLSLSLGYEFSFRQESSPVKTATNHLTWLMLTYSYPIHYQK